MAQKQRFTNVKDNKIVVDGPGPFRPIEIPRVLKEIDRPDEIEVKINL
jgi:hypothetical protein